MPKKVNLSHSSTSSTQMITWSFLRDFRAGPWSGWGVWESRRRWFLPSGSLWRSPATIPPGQRAGCWAPRVAGCSQCRALNGTSHPSRIGPAGATAGIPHFDVTLELSCRHRGSDTPTCILHVLVADYPPVSWSYSELWTPYRDLTHYAQLYPRRSDGWKLFREHRRNIYLII